MPTSFPEKPWGRGWPNVCYDDDEKNKMCFREMKKFPQVCNHESFSQSKPLRFLGDLAVVLCMVVRKSDIPAMAWPGEC